MLSLYLSIYLSIIYLLANFRSQGPVTLGSQLQVHLGHVAECGPPILLTTQKWLHFEVSPLETHIPTLTPLQVL